jgi:hypothetical protein
MRNQNDSSHHMKTLRFSRPGSRRETTEQLALLPGNKRAAFLSNHLGWLLCKHYML